MNLIKNAVIFAQLGKMVLCQNIFDREVEQEVLY